jgi:hypothetical protein
MTVTTVTNGGAATPIPEEFKLLHLYWQASNYLSVGQVSISRDLRLKPQGCV